MISINVVSQPDGSQKPPMCEAGRNNGEAFTAVSGETHMQPHSLVAIVSLAALLVFVWMGLRVAGARKASGIDAPQMTGDPVLERHIRVQANTLEWLPIFLVSLWLFAIYWNDLVAAGLGVVWILGRVLYALGYVADPKKRELGFMIQALASAVLLFGALGRAIYIYATVGA